MQAITALLRLAPSTAILQTRDKDGGVVSEEEVPSALIQRGDLLKVGQTHHAPSNPSRAHCLHCPPSKCICAISAAMGMHIRVLSKERPEHIYLCCPGFLFWGSYNSHAPRATQTHSSAAKAERKARATLPKAGGS